MYMEAKFALYSICNYFEVIAVVPFLCFGIR